MKILHLIDVPWDSGLAHYALILGQGQKQAGHDVVISAKPGEKPWNKAARLGLDTVPYVSLSSLSALRRYIQERGINVLNAHSGSTHTLAVAAAWGQKVAVIRTRSDARPLRRRPGSSLLYFRTQRVIGAADYIRDSFISTFKLPPKKVVTIYQGIDTPQECPESSPSKPVLGIVARLDPVKGHRYLIEATALLSEKYPGLRVLVAGQEENIKTAELRSLAGKARVLDQIEFLGFQSDVQSVMARCSVGVIASTGSEAVSRVALEWMASGKPVVSTTAGCLTEMVKEGQTGYLVPPKDAVALAQGIDRLLREPARLQSMGRAGYDRARGNFSMKRFIDQTLEVYEQALTELR